jgi:hypothetical protein
MRKMSRWNKEKDCKREEVNRRKVSRGREQ